MRAAQEKLQTALAVLDRAAAEMRDVERYSAMPDGMSSWHPDQQEPVHEELAASVTDPAARLESCLEQAIPAFEGAEAQVWQFTAPKFARLADWVAPVIEKVSKLEEASRLMLDGVTRARDNMRIRAEIYADYQPPYRALERAHANIERAAGIALSLQTGLSRLQGSRAQGKPRASRPAPQESRPYAVRPGPGRGSMRIAPRQSRIRLLHGGKELSASTRAARQIRPLRRMEIYSGSRPGASHCSKRSGQATRWRLMTRK